MIIGTEEVVDGAYHLRPYWLLIWWNPVGHLKYRESVVINVSYFYLTLSLPKFAGCNNSRVRINVKKGAAALVARAQFRELVCIDEFPGEDLGRRHEGFKRIHHEMADCILDDKPLAEASPDLIGNIEIMIDNVFMQQNYYFEYMLGRHTATRRYDNPSDDEYCIFFTTTLNILCCSLRLKFVDED